jgi:hypothetical protein
VPRLGIALAVALACAACNPTNLKQGFCRSNSDCPGSTCNTRTWKCNAKPMDGGTDGDARDAGGDDVRDAAPEVPFNCHTANDTCPADAGVCSADGGTCVECLTNEHCSARNPNTPICAAQMCRACATDDECPDPNICLPDGHCATPGEVIFVDQTGCSADGGTTSTPYCTLTDGVGHLDSSHTVLVARGPLNGPLPLNGGTGKIFVVGKPGAGGPAKIGAGVGTTAATVSGGDVSIRDLEVFNGGSAASRGIFVTGSTTVLTLTNIKVDIGMGLGIQADNAAFLTMDRCTVTSNDKGGIRLDGTQFHIKNTKVTSNGTGDDNGASWGGFRITNIVTNGTKFLELVSVTNNNNTGISCTAGVNSSGVFASDNAGGVQVSGICSITLCSLDAGTTCGAQF